MDLLRGFSEDITQNTEDLHINAARGPSAFITVSTGLLMTFRGSH